MKLRLKQKTMIDILNKGAVAALTDEAQSDTTVFAPLLKSVKIKAENDTITVESAIKTLAVQYKYTIDPNEATVKENGEVTILAKELMDWVKRQPECDILLNLKLLDTPQLISAIDGDSAGKASIKKLGTVELLSRDLSKTGTKWSLDCYDASQVTWVDFQKPDALFEVNQALIQDAVKSTGFAAMPTHNLHVTDAFAFQKYKDKIFVMAGDGVRMALYDLNGAKNINLSFTYTVPCKVLSSVVGLMSEDETVSFGFDEKKHRAFIYQDNYIVRTDTAEQANVDAKIPPISYIFDQMIFTKFARISKGVLASRLSTASLVNKKSVLYVFKGAQLLLHAISDVGVSPNTCTAPLLEHTRDLKTLWSVSHIMELIKALPDDEISIMMPPDSTKVFKIISEKNPCFSYYAREADINGTKYSSVPDVV
jgi:DNA polymerase III sliding clamp (beta) subunit (PCNA family)